MKFGVYITTCQYEGLEEADVFANSLYYADVAERLGYSTIWLLEHHFTRYGICGDPVTLASFLLGRTRNIEVGTAITILPLRHPIRLAEQTAMLDHLSGGRFLLGIGRGYFMKDFEAFGMDPAQNHLVMEEWSRIMFDAWQTGTCSADSDLIKIPEVEVKPRPFTPRHPPVYVASSSPSRVEWAAARGLPMLLDYGLENSEKRSLINLYNDEAERHGFDPRGVGHVLSCMCFVDERPSTFARVRENMVWWESESLRASQLFDKRYDHCKNYEYYHRMRETAMLEGKWLPQDRIDNLLSISPCGSPQQCIDRLAARLDGLEIGAVALGFEAVADRQMIADSMQRFMEEVAPHVGATEDRPLEAVAELH
jgi:alkanal monooxygenase alpha chain